MNEKIEIVGIRRSPRPPLLAYMDVQIGDWVIFDFRLISQDNGRLWVSLPQSNFMDSSGTRRYKNLMTIPRDLQQRVETAVLMAWEQENRNDQTTK